MSVYVCTFSVRRIRVPCPSVDRFPGWGGFNIPFTLTNRAAIDNELLDLMMHDATKMIGPEAQAETLEWKHCGRWQEKECKG